MNEEEYIGDILGDPEAFAPRKAFADWLAEAGDPRAKSVGIGIEVKKAEDAIMDDLDSDLRYEELVRKQRQSNVPYSRKYLEKLPVIDGVRWERFEGGVIERVTVTDADSFAKNAETIFDHQPIHQFVYPEGLDEGDGVFTILNEPAMARLGALHMGGNYDGPKVCQAIAGAEHLRNLLGISLVFTSIGDEGIAHLSRAQHLSGLRDLSLNRNELTATGLRGLANSEALANLETLMLGWNEEMGEDTGGILADSQLNRLCKLDLSDTEMNADGFIKLMESGKLDQIEWLMLARCALDGKALESLFAGGRSPRLRRLNLLGNKTTSSVLSKLSSNPMPALIDLRLELRAPITEKALRSFTEAEWLPQVEKLALAGVTPEISAAVAGAPWQSLEALSLLDSNEERNHDEAVALVAGLASLKSLHLHVTVSDKAMDQLCQMKNLRFLSLREVSAEQKARIRKALPKCRVE